MSRYADVALFDEKLDALERSTHKAMIVESNTCVKVRTDSTLLVPVGNPVSSFMVYSRRDLVEAALWLS